MAVAKRPDIKAVVGPNLYITPRQIPTSIDLSRFIYLHPSPWVVDLWREQGYVRSPLFPWPTGIDVAAFPSSPLEKKHVLIYFKERFPEELEYAKQLLTTLKIPYEVLVYGSYREEDYRRLLSAATYVLWIGRQESQGIALQEALATNTPILVWDVPSLGHWQASKKSMAIFSPWENAFTGATAAYYFDARCGLKFTAKAELESKLLQMETAYKSFSPRSYVTDTLSLEKQARDLLAIFTTHLKATEEELKDPKVKTTAKWRNGTVWFRALQSAKDAVRRLIS